MPTLIYPNTITVNNGGSSFACCHIPIEVAQYMPPDARESFLDYGDGSEPICARVFMSKSQYDGLPAAVRGGQVSGLSFSGMGFVWPPDSAPVAQVTVNTNASLLGLIKKTIVLQADKEPVYELLFVSSTWNDRRAWYADSPHNLLSDDKLNFVDPSSGTTAASVALTYQQVIDDWTTVGGFTTFGSLPSTPSAQPLNASLAHRSPIQAIAALLRPLGMVLAQDPWSNARTIKQIDYNDPGTETQKLKTLAGYAGTGGSGLETVDGVSGRFVPLSVNVVFPDSVKGYGDPQVIAASNPVGSTGVLNETLFVGDHFKATGKAYSENLGTIAAERGTAFFKRVNLVPAVWTFAGPVAVTLGQTIRRVRISSDLVGGCQTTVWQHGLYDVEREGVADKFGFGTVASARFTEMAGFHSNNLNPRDDGTYDLFPFPVNVKSARLTSAWAYGSNSVQARPCDIDGNGSTSAASFYLNLLWPPDTAQPPQYFPYTNGAQVLYLAYPHGLFPSFPGTSAGSGLVVGWRQIPFATANHQGVFAFGAGTNVQGLWMGFVQAHQ